MSIKNFIDLSVLRLKDNRVGTVVYVYNDGSACVEIEETNTLVDITPEDVKEIIWKP